MTAFAVGDIQGCYNSLRYLLDKLSFDPEQDTLWVAGDMVNRGPDSLKTLRFLKSLNKSCIAVLGNHDLHLLAVAEGIRKQKKGDTLKEVLAAPDIDELLHWLRHCPFLHHNKKKAITMVHAGIPPIWTLAQAKKNAKHLEKLLQDDSYPELLKILFKSDCSSNSQFPLAHKKTLRLAANYFTRMRFCDSNGHMDLNNKSNTASGAVAPWYTFKQAPMHNDTIIFGHWAALEGKTGRVNIHALDTGCVWGKTLTAINLTTFKRTHIESRR
ncbi:MAG: symmetrical bis(5'-nucleosyl)-tetraphosphatase [Endozoicomonas sp. (ex Botrylloides leachii)]|nr:symmetrical bis(5'-nucleosyl)-tetraphosphatase [Endozoicomonas sp. (ex Botrylloides leachii)]